MPFKIDVFPHILPRRFFDRLMDAAPGQLHMLKRMRNLPALSTGGAARVSTCT